jgi:hypothetical protein
MANAGVVGMAEVVVPSSAPGGRGGLNGGPATWSFIWVGFAALILVTMHLALVGRGR